MHDIENAVALRKCTDAGMARLAKYNVQVADVPGIQPRTTFTSFRSARADEAPNPTKELDALVLGNTLIGYADNISLTNMTIIENIIKFSKMEADRESRDQANPAAWHRAFLQCMEDMGCYIPISASVEYRKRSATGTMKNVATAIVKAGVEAAKAAIPGATVLSAVADSTLSALEKETAAIQVFNYEATKAKGVKLAILPCAQAQNGLIIVSCSSVDHVSGKVGGGVLFLDLLISNVDIYQGSNFLTFNPAAYDEIKDEVEAVLTKHRREVLAKRFSKRGR